MRKRIVVLGLGGTISSVLGEDGLQPGTTSQELLAKIPELGEFYDLETRELMHIDSSNLQPHHWLTIATAIHTEIVRRDVDGIVVAHGTDTMSYTSSAIAFLIPRLNKPVVFTGSQIPFSELGSDGKKNLIDAVRVAAEADIAESVIVFNSKILRAVRTIKLREYDLNAFECVDPTYIGEISFGIHMYDETTVRRTRIYPTLDTKLEEHVAMLKIFPGMSPEFLTQLPKLGYRGLVLDAYGAGNVPILENSLLDAIKYLFKSNFPVVITSQCVFGTTELLYETGIKAHEAGAIQGFDMLAEVALIKLMYVLGRTTDMAEIEKLMQTNFAGEINPLIQSR